MIDRENLFHRTNEYTYSFKTFRTINTFDRDICNGQITLKETDENQRSLLVEIMNFMKQKNLPNPEKTKEKKHILNNLGAHFEGRE